MTKTKFNQGDNVKFEHEGETIIGNIDCYMEGSLYVVSIGNVFTILYESEMTKIEQ